MRKILSGLSIVMAGRLVAAAIGLITQIYLAQTLSAAALGNFFLATSLAAFLAIIATWGLPLITTRFLVRYRRRTIADFSGLYMQTTRRVVMATALIVASVGMIAIWFWPGLEGGQRSALLVGCLAVPGFALARLSGAAATAYRRYRLAYLPELLARPAAFLLLVVGVGLLTSHVDLVLTVGIFALLVSLQALYQYGALRKVIPRGRWPKRAASRLRFMWVTAALPLTGVILITSVFGDVAILSSGLFLVSEDLAVFGVCVKVALIVGFMQTLAHRLMQPDIAEALAAGDRGRLSQTVGQANLIGVGIGIVAFAAVASTGDLVLSLFGEHFIAGRNVLLALLAGQIFLAAAGPAIQVLALAKGQTAAAWSSLAAGACLLATSAALVPEWGLTGAAASVVATQILWAALLAYQVRRTGHAADIVSVIGLHRRAVPSRASS